MLGGSQGARVISDIVPGAAARLPEGLRRWLRVIHQAREEDAARVRAAYGTGIKNPGYYELYGFIDGIYIGNPDVKPEKSKGWEAGVEQSFGADNWATLGVTWFDSKLTDEIFTDYPPPKGEVDYVFEIPGGTPSRCNPRTAPPDCTPAMIESP